MKGKKYHGNGEWEWRVNRGLIEKTHSLTLFPFTSTYFPIRSLYFPWSANFYLPSVISFSVIIMRIQRTIVEPSSRNITVLEVSGNEIIRGIAREKVSLKRYWLKRDVKSINRRCDRSFTERQD